jgi:dolichol-phosphate mannosyltransferase
VDADWPWRRKVLSGFANAHVRAFLGLGIQAATAGYKVWRSSALEAISLGTVRSNGYSFQVEMNSRAMKSQLKVIELQIHFLSAPREAPK